MLAFALAAVIEITARSRSVRPGELVVLTLTVPVPADDVHVRAFDRDLQPFRIDEWTWRVLVGIDLDARPGTYAVDVSAGAMHVTHSLVVRPRVFPTRHLNVDEAFVTPPPSVQDQIDRDARFLTAVWDASAPERLWQGSFIRPVKEPANSAFGTRSVFNGKPRNAHGGADFLSPAGTPIHAPNAGRIVAARLLYFSGNTVIIDHGLGLFSMFAHLSAIEVHEGDRVSEGQVLGKVGATGRVTGPHLHWAVRASGARVDPLALVAVLGPHGVAGDGEPLGRVAK